MRDAFSAATVRFDEYGRPVETSTAETGSELVTYDAAGRPVELLDGEGGLTRLERDPAGRVTAVTSPSGARTTYEYDVCGRPAAATDAAGVRTRLTYDADSRVTERSSGDEVERIEYDAVGRVVATATPGSGTSRFRYDAAGRLVSVTDTRFGRRRFRYDAAGQLVEAVNGLGGVTVFTYDERGRMTSVTDPLGGVTRRVYDEADRVVAVTDPLGRTTTAQYDAAGRQTAQTDPDGRTTTWTFDAVGRAHQVVVDGAIRSEARRDPLGRTLVVTDHTRGPGREVDHELEFDRRGLLVRRSRGGTAVRWEYDADGNRTARIDPDGVRTTYRRDAVGRVNAVQRDGLGQGAFAFDSAGRIVQSATGDVVQTWSYEGGVLVAHTTTTPEGASTTRIDRDDTGRIRAVDGPDGRVEYDHDDAGQLVRAGTSTWTYDEGGRLVRELVDGVETIHEYDVAGQLLSTVRNGERVEYVYDGLGRRVRRTEPDGSTVEYAWSDLGAIAGVVSRDRTYAETGHTMVWVDALGELAEVGDVDVWWDSASPAPTLVAIGGETVLDLPGGAVAVGDAWTLPGWRSARATDAADPWAVLASVEGADLPAGIGLTASGGVSVAGLEWLRARIYDPAARGFLSVDPLAPVLGAGWSANPYSYAGNDPLHAVDPLGLRPATDEDLRAYRDAHQGAFAAAGSWWNDNWEYVVAGAAIVGGIALMCTGVGGVAGLALLGASGALMSGGISVASQKATTGQVDWREAGKQTAIGAVTGMIGGGTGAALTRTLGSGTVGRAFAGAGSGALEGGATGVADYATSPGPHTVTGVLGAAASSAVVGAATGGTTAAGSKWLDIGNTKKFAGWSYHMGHVDETTVLHRSGNGGGHHTGDWWSTDAPSSVTRVRAEKALPLTWRTGEASVQNTGFTAQFDQKMPAYRGFAGPQRDLDGTLYRGGGNQTYVPGGWEHAHVLHSWKLAP
nr:RHS repeat-associated core domain-containing protein [Curtobacterium sp. MCPF17_011]